MNQNTLNKLQQFSKANEPMKVEFANIKELKSLVNQARGVESDMTDAYLKARQSSKVGVAAAEKHLQNLKEISRLAEDVKSAANELGVDFSKIEEWKLADDFLNGNPTRPTEIMIERMKNLL